MWSSTTSQDWTLPFYIRAGKSLNRQYITQQMEVSCNSLQSLFGGILLWVVGNGKLVALPTPICLGYVFGQYIKYNCKESYKSKIIIIKLK